MMSVSGGGLRYRRWSLVSAICFSFFMYIFDIKNKTRTGIVVIFTWRILAKSTPHLLLPPTFRLLSHAFTLPNRRFYTPATDYGSVPSELGLRPIPSVMDLSGELGFGHGETSGVRKEVGTVRVRGVGNDVGKGVRERSWQLEENEGEKDVKHYDADGESLSISWSYTDDFVASSYEGDRILRDCGVGLRDFACNVRNSRMGCKVVV